MASTCALFPSAAALRYRSKIHGGLRAACLPAARPYPRSRGDPARRIRRNSLPGSGGQHESAIGRPQAVSLADGTHQGFATLLADFALALFAILFDNFIL